MRNPIVLSALAPRERGYYQRAFFDAFTRNSTRAFGVLVCLFGANIALEALGSALRRSSLHAIAQGLWALMALDFAVLWGLGLLVTIWRLVQGKSVGWSDWFRMRKTGIELGPIDVFPAVTPQMQREATLFTAGFAILVCVAAGLALFR